VPEKADARADRKPGPGRHGEPSTPLARRELVSNPRPPRTATAPGKMSSQSLLVV
jgi:hypothetical protein